MTEMDEKEYISLRLIISELRNQYVSQPLVSATPWEQLPLLAAAAWKGVAGGDPGCTGCFLLPVQTKKNSLLPRSVLRLEWVTRSTVPGLKFPTAALETPSGGFEVMGRELGPRVAVCLLSWNECFRSSFLAGKRLSHSCPMHIAYEIRHAARAQNSELKRELFFFFYT